MTRLPLTLAPLILFATVTAGAAGLPDTGQDTCYNDSGADGATASSRTSISADTGSHPRQDCRYGRDAAAAAGKLAKIGDGAKGFDYSKIANNGAVLAAGSALGAAGTDWACTRDNITGLTWENKTGSISDLRYGGHTYTWYNSTVATNGGADGDTGGNTCNATLPGNFCNTRAFVSALNTAALCTFTDWRLPSMRELLTLVYADSSVPSIDSVYFPNPPATPFWTASPAAADMTNAWFVDFADGYSSTGDKSRVYSVRAVRGSPF